jgi:signal transduction histidine kinase
MKKRIFVGLAPMLVLFVGAGIYAIWLFTQLGSRIDVILRENFRSVLAGQEMKETSERMDSGLFFGLVGEEARGRLMFDQNRPLFAQNLRRELSNITLPGEQELADKISALHGKRDAQAELFWSTADLTKRRQMYFDELLPIFTEIKNTAQKIIHINQENMVTADRLARKLSSDSTRAMFFVLVGGVAIALYFGYRLQRSILTPIQMLTAVSKELGEGNLDQVVPVQSKDELGQLADAFNKLTSKLRAYRQVTTDQVLQARQMTEITFSAFPDAILAISADGKINYANPAADRLLQRLDFGLPDEIQGEIEKVLKGAPDYMPTSFEKAVPVRSGDSETFLLPRVVGMRDESGALFGAAAVLQDVTRFRLLDEVKTNLVSTVSHELKTPLTSVRMGLHLLLEERIGSLNPKQLELLLAAREDSERLLRMINDLLDLARLEAGQTRRRLEIVSPRKLVDDAIHEFTPVAESHECRLRSSIAADLPEVAVDVRQIEHVFSNLVTNAVKHTPAGEQVLITVEKSDSGVRFSVVDHGPGIPPEFQPRIFDRFFRIPGTEESSGVGLGLAIAKEIVVAHGGTIGVESKPDEGTEFYFHLPAAGIGVKT